MIGGVTEAVKHEIKKKKVIRAGRGYYNTVEKF